MVGRRGEGHRREGPGLPALSGRRGKGRLRERSCRLALWLGGEGSRAVEKGRATTCHCCEERGLLHQDGKGREKGAVWSVVGSGRESECS